MDITSALSFLLATTVVLYFTQPISCQMLWNGPFNRPTLNRISSPASGQPINNPAQPFRQPFPFNLFGMLRPPPRYPTTSMPPSFLPQPVDSTRFSYTEPPRSSYWRPATRPPTFETYTNSPVEWHHSGYVGYRPSGSTHLRAPVVRPDIIGDVGDSSPGSRTHSDSEIGFELEKPVAETPTTDTISPIASNNTTATI